MRPPPSKNLVLGEVEESIFLIWAAGKILIFLFQK